MTCDPHELAELSKCYAGLTPALSQGAALASLCATVLPGPPLQTITTDTGNPANAQITLQGTQNAVRIFNGATPLSEQGFTLNVVRNIHPFPPPVIAASVKLYPWQGRIIYASPGDTLAFGTVDGRQLQVAPLTLPDTLTTATGMSGTANIDQAAPPLWAPTAAHIVLPDNASAFQISQTNGEQVVFISEFDGTQWSNPRWVWVQANYDVTVQCNYREVALASASGTALAINAPIGSTIGGVKHTPTLLPAMTGTQRNVNDLAGLNAAIAAAVSGDRIVLAAGTYTLGGVITEASFTSNHNVGGKKGMEGITIMGATGTRGDVIIVGRFNINQSTATGPATFKDLSINANGAAASCLTATSGVWILENVDLYGTGAANVCEVIASVNPITWDALLSSFRNSGADCINGDGSGVGSPGLCRFHLCTGTVAGALANDQVITPHNGLAFYCYGCSWSDANTNVVAGATANDKTYLAFCTVSPGAREGGAQFGLGVWAYGSTLTSKAQLGPNAILCKITNTTTSNTYRNYTGTVQSCRIFINNGAAAKVLHNSIAGGTLRNCMVIVPGLGTMMLLANSASAQALNFAYNNTYVSGGAGSGFTLSDANGMGVNARNNAVQTGLGGTPFNVTAANMALSTVDYNVLNGAILDPDYVPGANDIVGTDPQLDAFYFPTAGGNCDANGTDTSPTFSIGDSDPFGFVYRYDTPTSRGARSRPIIIPSVIGPINLYPDLW